MANRLQVSDGVLLTSDGQAVEDLALTGNLTVDGTVTASGGITQEQISFTTGELSTTAALTTTSGVPRWTLPDAATTSVFFNLAPPNWWDGFNVIASVVNDHSATGNVRLTVNCRETDYATQAITAGGLIINTTATHAAPAINGGLTFFVLSTGVARAAGAFGSLYSFEVTRLGTDGADTLAGPLAIAGVTIGRV